MFKFIQAPIAMSIFALLVAGCAAQQAQEPTVSGPLSTSAMPLVEITGDNCVTLLAGQTIEAGQVCATVSGDDVNVTYETSGGWGLYEVHAWAGTALADMPQNKQGNPKIGNFPINVGDLQGATSYTFTLPLSLFGLSSEQTECDPVTAYLATHAVVKRDNGDGTFQAETAWGEGPRMVQKGSWATWFSLKLECYAPCVPGFDPAAFSQSVADKAGSDELVTLRVQHQGGNAGQPYFRGSLDFDADGTAEESGLALYCVDLDHTISSNKDYCARMYSSYDQGLPTDLKHPENLDAANYVVNTFAIGDILFEGGAAVTGGDMQRTLWKLVYGTLVNPGAYASGPSSNANVDHMLAAAATSGEGYQPPCDGVVAVILFPVSCTDPSVHATQTLIGQMLVSSFENACTVCEEKPSVGTCETAFARGNDGNTCFIGADFDGDSADDGFNRWGWSIGPLSAGSYSFEVYAGAGQCSTTKGTLVGSVHVDYDGSNAKVSYSTLPGFHMDEAHAYAGAEPLPRDVNNDYTVAPGQYTVVTEFDSAKTSYSADIAASSSTIYVVAHAVVCSESWPK